MPTETPDQSTETRMYQYRYFTKPKPMPTVCWPGIGNFVVFSIDPVASVAHLDKIARRAARKIPVHRFVALTMTGHGLPMENKPYTSFLIAPVRQGLPTLHNPPWDTPDMCYPIFPNTYHPKGRETLRPLHPLPLPDCYIETTRPFLTHSNLTCRITTTPRDYTPVLPMPSSQLSRLRRLMNDEVHNRTKLRRVLEKGDLDAFASIPLPASPMSACNVPLPPSPLSARDVPLPTSAQGSPVIYDARKREDDTSSDSKSMDSVAVHTQPEAEEVSLIGSDDGSDSVATGHSEATGSEIDSDDDAADAQLDAMLRFEDLINDTGNLRDPVVNVWYDLDMVTEVTDPLLFIEARDQLRKIMDEAEIRLGLRSKFTLSQEARVSSHQTDVCEKSERPASEAPSSHSCTSTRPEQERHFSGVGRLLNKLRGRSLKMWNRARRLVISPCHDTSATEDMGS
ncbi:hypothetical protein PENSPDRAFT_731411 [Peniophora sp. CONT]|nr:hypothetical protein PENSPDRAFT_731411 [Peniophora sp. CONT]